MRPVADRVDLLNEVPAPRSEPVAEQAPLAWWHLRTWRVDRDILVRVRDGLHALAPRPAAPLTETEMPETGAEPPGAAPAAPLPGRPSAAPPLCPILLLLPLP